MKAISQIKITLCDDGQSFPSKRNFIKPLHPNPQFQKDLFGFLADCQVYGWLCPFTTNPTANSSYVYHGAIRGNYLHSFEAEPLAKGIDLDANNELPSLFPDLNRALCSLYFEETTLFGEVPLSYYSELTKHLYSAADMETPYSFGDYSGNGKDIIGFNVIALECGCSNHLLNLKGCPSARGERCPSIYPISALHYYKE